MSPLTLTGLALRRPLTVYVLMVIVVIGGLATYRALPRESFPEIRIPLIIVSTAYPGTSPSDMESQITRKIETEIKGIAGIKEIRSTSLDGYALIEVEFNPDVDLDTALQKVRESVDRAEPDLPEDAEDTAIADVDFSQIPIMIVNLAAEFGIDRLKEIADDLKDDLEAIPGVNQVQLVGGRDREVQVYVDPRRLSAYRLGLGDLVEAIEREHLTMPGGDIDVGRLNLLVRLPAEVDDPLEIRDFVVAEREGRTIHVRDVATVIYGLEEEETRARMNGRPAISLTVEKRTGANIVEVAQLVRDEVDRLRERLPSSAEVKVVADQSEDIEEMVRNLENNILSGLLLVLVVLFLVLGIRPAIIVSSAIPFAMLVTFLFVALFGYTLNMVVLFSLVLVLGMLVDNAIVTVENIYRHREMGEGPLAASRTGTNQVALPIIASTATTLCAFAPMLVWPGIVGEFMKYLPITLIIGLSASLFVALVFNPTLAMAILVTPRPQERQADRKRPVIEGYRKVLAWCLDRGPEVPFARARNWLLLGIFFLGLGGAVGFALMGMLLNTQALGWPMMVLAAVGGLAFVAQGAIWLCSGLAVIAGKRSWITDHRARILWSTGAILAATFAAYGFLGKGSEFFPDIDPRSIWVDMEFAPGTNLDGQDALVRNIEGSLGGLPDLEDVVANVGSTGLSMDAGPGGGGSDESRVTVNLLRFHERSQSSTITMAKLRQRVAGLTGARITVDKPQEGPPTGKPVSVRLIGDEYESLGRTAEELRDRLAEIEGLYNVNDDYDEGKPEVRVVVDREAAARARTNTRDIAFAVRTALAGTEVAKFRTGEDEYEITVRLPRSERLSLDSLEELTVLDEDERPIPLKSLARIEPATGPASIKRTDLHRVITVEADVDHAAGYRDPDMRNAVAQAIDAMTLPEGVDWEFAGSNEEEEESRAFLSRAFVIALLLIGLILVTEFDSLITPLTVLVSVILSLIGVLWGLILTRTPFGIIMTGIGVISLAGIVVNNAIVLCDFILRERRQGTPKTEAIITAGAVRLRPVLLTAVTTILGLIPLTTGFSIDFFALDVVVGSESSQWWGPMGVAVIFGLAVATVLTLVVLPVTYDVLDDLSSSIGAQRRRSWRSRAKRKLARDRS